MKRRLVAVVLAMALTLSGSMVALAEDTQEGAKESSGTEIEITTEEPARANKSVAETTEEKDKDTEKIEDENAKVENTDPKSHDAASNRAGDVLIDAEHFPDTNFREYVKSNFDTDGNGNLSQDEIDAVTSIDISDQCVGSDLTGIEIFSGLLSLDCSGNNLSNLDVSKNTSLTYLDCWFNNLSNLDVSKNINLTYLNCYGNELSSLDVSKNTSLTSLECSSNNLSSLDVSKNMSLTYLECGFNNLSNLDTSKNMSLTHLDCYGNELSNLDVNKNTSLMYLGCGFNNLSSLDVSKNTSLTSLECSSNNLSNLDVSKNTSLTHLACDDNNLSNLDVSKNTRLTYLVCGGNDLSNLDVSKNTSLSFLNCGGNKLGSLDLSNIQDIKDDFINTATVPSQVIYEDGVWKLDLLPIIGSGTLDRVTLTTEGTELLPDGTVIFWGSIRPTELTYNYDTRQPSGVQAVLEVTVSFTEDSEQPELRILPEVTDNTHVIGSPEGATIVCTGELKDFVNVLVDDELVDESNYTLAEGSTILTFLAKYLDTLSVGKHKVTLNYTYASIDTELRILDTASATDTTNKNTPGSANNTNTAQNTNSVNTGDNAPIVFWMVIALTAASIYVCTSEWRKRYM